VRDAIGSSRVQPVAPHTGRKCDTSASNFLTTPRKHWKALMPTSAIQYHPVVAKRFAAGRYFSVAETSSARLRIQDFHSIESFYHYEEDCVSVGMCCSTDYG
jgi:hypothetical protein